MKKFALIAALIGMTVFAIPAEAKYIYLHTEGEYSVELPEAPTGVSIWADDPNIPYLEDAPKFGLVGEHAIINKVDPITGGTFNVDITFLKANRDYLLSLTQEKIAAMIDNDYKAVKLEGRKPGYAPGSDTLKWSTLTGFSVSKDNRPVFNATHFLVGQQSIMVIRVQYDVENQVFNELYKNLSKSIKFNAQ